MPPTAAEVCIYDSEALSPRATAAALTHGQRLGYCATISGIWTAGTRLHDIHGDLEDRYLRETMNEDLDG